MCGHTSHRRGGRPPALHYRAFKYMLENVRSRFHSLYHSKFSEFSLRRHDWLKSQQYCDVSCQKLGNAAGRGDMPSCCLGACIFQSGGYACSTVEDTRFSWLLASGRFVAMPLGEEHTKRNPAGRGSLLREKRHARRSGVPHQPNFIGGETVGNVD
jgi:hypothetical protein